MQSLNSPEAPLLQGGIPVPGGHIVWVPESSLASSAASGPQLLAPAEQGNTFAAPDVQPAVSLAPASGLTASPGQLTLPLPVTDYSKVVAYGPDGRRQFVWYRSSAPSAAARASDAPGRGGSYEVADTGLEFPGPSSSLTAEDRRVERDLLLHLMSSPSPHRGRHPSAARFEAPGRQQQLVEVSAAGPGASAGWAAPRALVVAAAAALLAIFGPWAR